LNACKRADLIALAKSNVTNGTLIATFKCNTQIFRVLTYLALVLLI